MKTLPFALSHSHAKNYNFAHEAFLKKGDAIRGTSADLRLSVQEAAQFQEDDVMVYTNHDKQQVVLAKSVAGADVDESFVPKEALGEISQQTFRSVMGPNEYGTLEVTERVDSRRADGELAGSWTRIVESDPMVGGFSIHIPGR